MHAFSDQQIAEARAKYPELNLIAPGSWKGSLDMNAEFDQQLLQDRFEVVILLQPAYSFSNLPTLQEIGGRTERIAEKYEKADQRTLHRNPHTKAACLCAIGEEDRRFPPGSSLVDFVENLAIPYLYGLSFYDVHGRWPWKEYTHGGLGLLESHAEDSTIHTTEAIERLAAAFREDTNWKKYRKHLTRPRPRRHCVCSSRIPFEDCHKQAWMGLQKLHSDLRRLKLNSYRLFTRE